MVILNTIKKKKKKEVEQRDKRKTVEGEVTTTPDFKAPDVTTVPKKFNINGKQVTEEEFKAAQSDFQAQKGEAQIIAAGGVGPQEREAKAEELARKEEGAQILQEGGFDPLAQAERTQLDIDPKTGQGIPVIGPGQAALQGVIGDFVRGSIFEGDAAKMEPLIQDPETAREVALQAIQQDVINEGISAGEAFGALVESIPLVGSLANKYAQGLIENPKGNIQTITTQIASERERASVLAEKMLTGKMNPITGLAEIDNIEENIVGLEQRIVVLANTSAALRADADAINLIEEQILRAKERVIIARNAAAGGFAVTPSDASLVLELEKINEKS